MPRRYNPLEDAIRNYNFFQIQDILLNPLHRDPAVDAEYKREALQWAITCQRKIDKIITLLTAAMNGGVISEVTADATRNFEVLKDLCFAAKTDDIDVFRRYHEEGAAFNHSFVWCDDEYDNFLVLAVKFQSFQIIRFLVENELCDINAAQKNNESALALALNARHEKIVNYLLEHGAMLLDSEAVKTAAFYASFVGNLSLLKDCIEKEDFFVNAPDHDDLSNTALMHAADYGHTELVEYLLSQDADVNAVNEAGQTALYFAVCDGDVNIVKMLIEHGADIKTDSWDEHGEGRHLGHVAGMYNRRAVYDYLVAHAPDLFNQPDSYGLVPEDYFNGFRRLQTQV
jgi:uncharacterized protein YozE (UPF0346 family)